MQRLEEDDVSDKDLPELAPITTQEFQRAVLQQNSQSLDSPSVEKKDDQEDLESDLGKTLSPLGSTSSLQDLIESSSARGSADPMMPRNTQSSAWIERERNKKPVDETSGGKKSVVVIEPPLEATAAATLASEATEVVETDSTMIIAAKQKLAPSQRMDSVTSAKTNETSTTATSDDYATAPEMVHTKSTTEEDDEEEVEKVEHYLETPPDEQPPQRPQDEEEEKLSQQQYSAVCEIQLKSNTDSGLEISESKQNIKSPTHSFASSSSGSYSVHNNTENGRKISPPTKSISNNGSKPEPATEKPCEKPLLPTEQTELPEKPTQIEMSSLEDDDQEDLKEEMQLHSTSTSSELNQEPIGKANLYLILFMFCTPGGVLIFKEIYL